MKEKGIRVEIDARAEKIGYKIREAQLHQIPYMLVVGEKEVQDNRVSVRNREQGDLGQMNADDFIAKVLDEIDTKAK